ncbi:hypothetical protein Tco_1539214, partial [Tanacetum coccineum]
CMRTRNSNFPNNSNVTIPRRRNKGRAPNIVEPELRTIVAPMAERSMEELLREPTKKKNALPFDAKNLLPTIKSFSLNNGKARGLVLAKYTVGRELHGHAPQKASRKAWRSRQVSYTMTGRALIDVYGEEITLRVDNEAVTFNLDQTTRYSSTNDKSVNRIDIIDAVCEEYALELLGFSNSSGGNPTPTSEPFTSEFILEEIEAYLKDDRFYTETCNHADCDPEEDICLIEKLLNNDPFQLPPMDLKQSEVTEAKSSIEEPPELELKDLPSHLEYAYLEENDKLPVIIAKGLKDDEKDALLKVLKSHKRAIAWKITDIKGIDPRFCTHKILMEDDYKPTVQSQRWVNPKIHEVIKKEVLKLLDAGMI